MARAQLTNNAATVLASGISNVATSLTVAAGKGALFPAPGANYFYCTLTEGTLIEVVKATARTGDVFTVTRAQDGTSAQTFTAAATIKLNLTAAVMAELATLSDTETLTNKTLTTPVLTGTKETKVAIGANNIDLATGNYFSKTISGATTLTVSNVPSTGITGSFIVDLTNGGSATITWWSGMKWAGGSAPALTAAGRDVLGFFSHDGGTTWTGMLLCKGAA